jgi:acyl-coenzyme A synthetase/AMP-(fatty) acid ligase
LFDGVRFTLEGDTTWASGGHVEQPVPMNDVIESVGETRFLLHGRMADLVNIAGRRNSLANLNLQLNAIPGVIDGAFFMPDEAAPDEATRLAAFVVAPGLTPAQLTAALRERVDMVFLPRPLVFVDALPRNATGKLPHEALRQLALAHLRQNSSGTPS